MTSKREIESFYYYDKAIAISEELGYVLNEERFKYEVAERVFPGFMDGESDLYYDYADAAKDFNDKHFMAWLNNLDEGLL